MKGDRDVRARPSGQALSASPTEPVPVSALSGNDPSREGMALNWPYIRRVLQQRREYRDLTARGYRKHETDWEILRGGRMGDVIVDARISSCGRYVWTKLGPPTPTESNHAR